MIHRHLDYPPDTPLAERGDAALDDLLDRGDLDDWRPLALALASDPFGAVADRVLRLCDANPRYGTSTLWRAWVARRRAMSAGIRAAPLPLSELRRRRGMTQAALGARIGMSQSDLSKAERRTDWKLSTIFTYLAGLGLRGRMVVEDEAGRIVGSLMPTPRQAASTDPDLSAPSTHGLTSGVGRTQARRT